MSAENILQEVFRIASVRREDGVLQAQDARNAMRYQKIDAHSEVEIIGKGDVQDPGSSRPTYELKLNFVPDRVWIHIFSSLFPKSGTTYFVRTHGKILLVDALPEGLAELKTIIDTNIDEANAIFADFLNKVGEMADTTMVRERKEKEEKVARENTAKKAFDDLEI